MAESSEVEAQRRRSFRLFFERWLEQLETSFTPRRARTLGALSALDEVVALAEGYVRSGGQTRPAIDPNDAGHGVYMLPDVVDEALDFLGADEVLRHQYAARKEVLQELTKTLRSTENIAPELIEQVKALRAVLRRDYLTAGFRTLAELVGEGSKPHAAVVALADSLVSELRVRGWSDEGLKEAADAAQHTGAGDLQAAVSALQSLISREPSEFECYVGVSLPQKLPRIPAGEPGFAFVDTLPDVPRSGRALKVGPYLRARVVAQDPAAAAAIAHQRSVSTLGALKVFVPGSQGDVSSDVVGVVLPEGLRSFEVQERLLEEHRSASQEEVVRILRSSWRVHELRSADPLHDAIRLRHRALVASDAESRLLLLWSGMERMTAGARGFESALSAARELVSHAVSFGKLRRDVGDLVACVQHHVAKDDARRKALLQLTASPGRQTPRVDRARFLEYLMGPESQLKQLVALVYDTSPLLAFRCHELWKALGEGKRESTGARMADYHDRSRERVSRQVARIYRARNRIAHVGASPDRVRDLVWHAHFYLTQLTAICVHYGERDSARAQDLLVRRVGQYKAFLRLLRAGDPSVLTSECLLRPSLAVG